LERVEQLCFEEGGEVLPAAENLDEAADDVDGERVVPLRSRLEQQRHAGKAIDKALQRHVGGGALAAAAHIVGVVQRVHGDNLARLVVAVRQARRVREQHANRDGRFRRHRAIRPTRIAAREHCHLSKRWNVLFDRLVQTELALLPQGEQTGHRERLAHAVQPEERILVDRLQRRRRRLEEFNLAVARHQARRKGQELLAHERVHPCLHAVETLAADASC